MFKKDYAYIITSHYSYMQGKCVCTNYVVALLLLILFASVWQTRDKSYGTRKTNYTVVLNNCTLSLFCNKRKICDYYCDKRITSPTLWQCSFLFCFTKAATIFVTILEQHLYNVYCWNCRQFRNKAYDIFLDLLYPAKFN